MNDFRKKILKVNSPRVYRINNSVGVYNSYKWIRKNKWLDIGGPVSEKDFYKIIRTLHKHLADCIARGQDVVLPYGMGRIELQKCPANIRMEKGIVKTNLPVDWDRTLRLWNDDMDAYVNRVLVRMESKEIYRIHYNRCKAKYSNKSFYELHINRDIKKKLRDNIREGNIDAFNRYGQIH